MDKTTADYLSGLEFGEMRQPNIQATKENDRGVLIESDEKQTTEFIRILGGV